MEETSEDDEAGIGPRGPEQKARLLLGWDSGPAGMNLQSSARVWGPCGTKGGAWHTPSSRPGLCASLYALLQGNIQTDPMAQFPLLVTLIK